MKNVILWAFGSIASIQGVNELPTNDIIGEIFKYLIQLVIAIISIIKILKGQRNGK